MRRSPAGAQKKNALRPSGRKALASRGSTRIRQNGALVALVTERPGDGYLAMRSPFSSEVVFTGGTPGAHTTPPSLGRLSRLLVLVDATLQVGDTGFEPVASAMSTPRSNQLS